MKQTTIKWYKVSDVSSAVGLTVKTLKEHCRNGLLNYRVERDGKVSNYFIHENSLPEYALNKLNNIIPTKRKYSEAPYWAKLQAEKYLKIINKAGKLKGAALMDFIDNWNIENPSDTTSYPCFMKMKRRYFEEGVSGLLAKYGKTARRSVVSDDLFDYFRNLYLDEGAPSFKTCWDSTLGYAIRNYENFDRETFPSSSAFKRRLDNEFSKQAVYMARYGQTAWNRKYGGYINRDYSTITCGKVWVSDHAQIDIACEVDGKVVFPWVTSWRDYKSGKWLGWYLQTGTPNSDHIFQTFYYAAQEYGLPEDVIIDNGKDYRCKDFAGGRVRIEADEVRTTAMLSELNVNVNFALPYNAQTKPIERDFRKIKELLSKHCVGYRGGNVVERPEKLAEEIKKGDILNFDEFKKIFDDFIINILNKRPSYESKILNGKSPDALFKEEFKEKVVVSHEALKLFCTRISRNFSVGRNGIKDRQLGITYWSDWMLNCTNLKVYLRRDPQNFKEAWVFKVDNDEFVGVAKAVDAVAALHADEISKEEFKTAMAIKKRNIKLTKSYIQKTREISITEKCENYKAAYFQVEKETEAPQVTKIANTKMDEAVRKRKEMEQHGKQDLKGLLGVSKQKKERTIYLFATEKKLAERGNQQEKGVVVNG